MRNLLLTLAYDGSYYHGWQVQENAVTVQERLQDAIEALFASRLPVCGCSRTDSGVHANMFCCNFRTNSSMECSRVISALNANLEKSIAVTACREMPANFHARYDCVSKKYRYLIWNAQVRNPFYESRAYHYKYPLDADFLNTQAQHYLGTHDFTSFCASGSSVDSKIRTLKSTGIVRNGDMVEFYVEADGFLYNMVRIMVGTLLGIAQGKIERDSISEIIAAKNRSLAGITAPACGLYLDKVNYN